ncbi:MAG TPA: DUF1844 domain-containing protein [Fimbriimonadaceae bacterium]|nr:DUF1844 domain-containing protein [Fimbriimonadaceae bacterium]
MAESAKEPANIHDIILVMLDQVAGIAWQKLGLQPDFITGQIHQDLHQAKVAIDLVAHLSGIVEPQLDDNDRRELQNLISNLRLNYVEKSK